MLRKRGPSAAARAAAAAAASAQHPHGSSSSASASVAPPASGARPLRVVLGSGSAGRRGVLERRGLAFEVMAADIDEKGVAGRASASPRDLALAVARAKAESLRRKGPLGRIPCILITADQIVLGPDGSVREKPSSALEARAFLSSYAGGSSRTVSAVVVTNTHTGATAEGVAVETIRYGGGLAAAEVLAAALLPAPPLDMHTLRPALRAGASLAGAGGAEVGEGAAAGDPRSSSKRRRRSSVGGGGAGPTGAAAAHVSIMDTAGAVMLEHPAIAPHVVAIERGDTVGAPEAREQDEGAADDEDVVTSIYGLPWRLTQQLVGKVAASQHPWVRGAKI